MTLGIIQPLLILGLLFETLTAADLPPVENTLRETPEMLQEISADPIKKAALTWATSECQRLVDLGKAGDAQSATRAEELAADIPRMFRDPGLSGKHEAPRRIMPNIQGMPNNPGAKSLFEISPYRESTPQNPKKLDRNPKLDDLDSLNLAYALLHPQSPAKDDPQALIALLTCLNQTWCARDPSPWSEAASLKALILLKSVYPNVVPASVWNAWTREIRSRGEKEIADYSKLFDDNYVSRSWLNGDVRNTLNVGYRGIILNDPALAKWTANAVKCMVRTLQPDGATNYTGYQNEAALYHDAAVGAMAWWWMFSGDTAARDFVIRSAPFYALGSHRFLCEEYTCPEQKHYYNGSKVETPHPGYLSGDPYAVAACLPDGKWVRHLNAFTFDPTLPVVQAPDRYTVFDRNIIGPRGRYGNLDFAISTRDFSYYPGKTDPVSRTPEKGFGVTTFLGMRVMNPPDFKGWPMNAVVERIMNHVRIGGKEYDKGELIESSVSMAASASAVSARYMTSGRAGQNVNWGPVPFSNTQAWIIDGERAVGLLRVTATVPVQDARMSTLFEFVSGRAQWGLRKELVSKGKWEHEYGDLRLRVIATSYQDFELKYTKGGLSGDDNMRALLRLVEESGKQDQLRSYAVGDTHWCLVELRPAWSAPATEIKPLDPGSGLIGFEFTASGKSFELVQNPTDSPQTASFAMPQGYSHYSLHLGTDGQVDRDKYLSFANWQKSQNQESGNQVVALRSPNGIHTVPPHRHILVIGSNTVADHQNGMKFYKDVFVNPVK